MMAFFMNAPQLIGASALFMEMKKQNQSLPPDQQVPEGTMMKVARTQAKERQGGAAQDVQTATEMAQGILTGQETTGEMAPPEDELEVLSESEAFPTGAGAAMMATETEGFEEGLMEAAMPVEGAAQTGAGLERMSLDALIARSQAMTLEQTMQQSALATMPPDARQAAIEQLNEQGMTLATINEQIAERQQETPGSAGTEWASIENPEPAPGY